MKRALLGLAAFLALLSGGGLAGHAALPQLPPATVSGQAPGSAGADWRTYGPAPEPAYLPGQGPPAPAAAPPDGGSGSSGAGSYRQIACWAYQGGWPTDLIPIAVAITIPESGGDPNAIQRGQPYATTGWGLFQITPGNSYPDLGVDYALLNPVTNARAALRKYQTQGWGAWTTYTGGQYARYLPGAESALAGFGYAGCGG